MSDRVTGSDDRLRRIVIVGGGSSGWMSAAALANAVGRRCQIILIESEDIGIIGVGEATIPPIKGFNRSLGIDEADFLRATQGSYKLAIEFVGWGDAASRYPHPFGSYGVDFDMVPLIQWWLRDRLAGDTSPLHAYSMAWAMAQAGRFAPPSPDRRLIQSTSDYAYHFDAALYGQFLRARCEGMGVERIEGRVTGAVRGGDGGDITHVMLADGRTVEGDFFIDCSGFRSLLTGEVLGVPFDDWSHWLRCDRAVAVPCASSPGRIDPYTRSTAHRAGWQWRIPLQHRVGNGHVYCSDHISDDAATATLLATLDGEPLAEPRLIRFTTGRRTSPWTANCVAIGLAAGFMEPLESTSLHLVQTGIARLIALLPGRSPDPLARAEYNRLTREEWERIRDFIILHYHCNRRDDGALWAETRAMPVPDELRWRIDHFKAHGRIVSAGPELFRNHAWQSVLIGQGVIPDAPEPIVAQRAHVDATRHLAGIRRVIVEAAAAMPDHAAVLAAL